MRGKKTFIAGSSLALAVAVTGCGSSGSTQGKGPAGTSGKVDAFTLVAATADKTAAEKNAKLAFDLTIETAGKTVSLTGDGVTDLANNGFELSMKFPAGSGLSGTIEEVFTGGILYLHLPSALQAQSGGKPWVSIDPKKITGSSNLDSYNEDPTSFLKTLKSVSKGGVTKVGDEDIRGVPTTHYRATADLEKAAKLRGVQPQAIAQYKKLLGDANLPEDVYVDDQGRARRVSVTIKPATGTIAASALKSETVNVDFFDFGKADTSLIKAPPAGEVGTLPTGSSSLSG